MYVAMHMGGLVCMRDTCALAAVGGREPHGLSQGSVSLFTQDSGLCQGVEIGAASNQQKVAERAGG